MTTVVNPSPLKAISFLGNFQTLRETCYLHPRGEGGLCTPFFQEALVAFYAPETLYVLVTPTAKIGIPKGESRPGWDILQEKLAGKTNVVEIPIPDGKNYDDIWAIFEAVTGCLQNKDRVLFDITNGFRSLPVIALAAVGLLRVARHVTVTGLIYGAFDAKNEAANETPIFDLLPVADLLAWTTATDRFLTSGDARELVRCLRQPASPPLNVVADRLDAVAQALALTRPRDVLPLSAQLSAALQAAETDVRRQAKPFNLLLERTRRDFQAFAEEKPDANVAHSLAAQWRLIGWYFDKQQLIQAATLAREWVISVLCWKLSLPWRDGGSRVAVERALGAHAFGHEDDYLTHVETLDPAFHLRDLWSQLAPLRNKLAHCDIRQNYGRAAEDTSAKKLAKKVRAVREPLRQVAEEFGLTATEENA